MPRSDTLGPPRSFLLSGCVAGPLTDVRGSEGAPAKLSRECERAVQSCGCTAAWWVTISQKRLARHGAWVGVIARFLFVSRSGTLRAPRSFLLSGCIAGPLTDVRGSEGAPAKPSRECERAVQSCGCSVAWLVTIANRFTAH